MAEDENYDDTFEQDQESNNEISPDVTDHDSSLDIRTTLNMHLGTQSGGRNEIALTVAEHDDSGEDQVGFMKEAEADASPETENPRPFHTTFKAMLDKFFNELQKESNKAALDDLAKLKLETGLETNGGVYPTQEIYELSTPQGSNKSIFRVHTELWKQSPTSYTPQLLSIGPYHHGNPMYASMEEEKKSYRHRFCQRSMTSEEEVLSKFPADWESKAGGYYSERVEMNNYEFQKMLLNDGAFSIEYMLTVCAADGESRFGRTMPMSHIQRDMKLLENQLPYFVLKDFWNLIPENKRGRFHSLEHLVATFFNIYKYNNATNFIPTVSQDPAHLVDLLRLLMVPDHQPPVNMHTNPGFMDEVIIMSTQELENSGIFIKVSKNPHLTDITFHPLLVYSGSLMIPCLTLDNTSEILFRNIIAYEQYYSKFGTSKRYITDYMIFMDGLLKQGSEKLLVRNGILVNNLIDGKSGMKLVKELCKDIPYPVHGCFHYAPLCRELDKRSIHCIRELKEWMLRNKTVTRPIFMGIIFVVTTCVTRIFTTWVRI